MYHTAKRDGQIINPVWIEIDLSVIFDKRTIFSNMLANTYGAPIFDMNRVARMIDFETILFEKDFYTRKEARKAEIMVSRQIDTDKIKGVHYGD